MVSRLIAKITEEAKYHFSKTDRDYKFTFSYKSQIERAVISGLKLNFKVKVDRRKHKTKVALQPLDKVINDEKINDNNAAD